MPYNVILSSVLAALGWGISPILDKQAMKTLDYKTISITRFLVFGLFAVVFFVWKLLSSHENIITRIDMSKRDYRLTVISSIAALLAYILYFYALGNSTNTNLVVILTYILPLFVVSTLSYLFLNEKLNSGMIFGIVLIFAGIFIFYNYKNK